MAPTDTPRHLTRPELYGSLGVLWFYLFLSLMVHTPPSLWVLRGVTLLFGVGYSISAARLRGRDRAPNRAA